MQDGDSMTPEPFGSWRGAGASAPAVCDHAAAAVRMFSK
jgi:hypothetical protein